MDIFKGISLKLLAMEQLLQQHPEKRGRVVLCPDQKPCKGTWERRSRGPQGMNKGLVAERHLTKMKEQGKLLDFILCVGDDRSDEDMFEVIMGAKGGPALFPVAETFACTVGQKQAKLSTIWMIRRR
ncbi:hypothetical protein Bca4012_023731 [Brassica carinata]